MNPTRLLLPVALVASSCRESSAPIAPVASPRAATPADAASVPGEPVRSQQQEVGTNGEEVEIGPGIFRTMFRSHASAPMKDGWHEAISTRGGFSVELPVPFNDFRLRATAEDGVEVVNDTIGATSPGLLAWIASCGERADGSSTKDAKREDRTEAVGGRAWHRTIHTEHRICVIAVEAGGPDPLPPEAEITRFLRSFRRIR